MEGIYKLGIDIGSTTIKAVVLGRDNEVVYSVYERHNARVKECLRHLFSGLKLRLGDVRTSVCVTGSVGMGVAEKCALPFLQEVVAAVKYVSTYHPQVKSLIDIGGEDAKVVFFKDGKATDLRMNGNCAGGTGAFIDQMSLLLSLTPDEMGLCASHAQRLYPIASRCGVFSKTDVQNLIAKNVSKEDIAASVFHAVAVQTGVTLSHGTKIAPPVLFCGGPLTFLPSLRNAFADYLQLREEDMIVPEKSNLIPAWGTALNVKEERAQRLSDWERQLSEGMQRGSDLSTGLPELFTDEAHLKQWKKLKSMEYIHPAPLPADKCNVCIGIDSGSTTTKIVVLDEQEHMLFHDYRPNDGNPVKAVADGLKALQRQCEANGTELQVVGGTSTGYGEDLIRTAFKLDKGIVETMAHYQAAKHIVPDVSFILDIGGQDMKAIFVDHGVTHRIEINEACSSGCGSFISTFATSLKMDVEDFAHKACLSRQPCDLGTRCTVFMNSKVKQALREGATIEDIAAGLSYSVVKNCLYKVLRLRDTEEIGEHVMLQGGTMKNDSVVRAFELMTGKHVYRSNFPELMGAYGCALHAMSLRPTHEALTLDEMLANARYATRQLQCHGCENQCLIQQYKFSDGAVFYSGNRCEKVFNNKGNQQEKGINAYELKRELLFPAPETAAGSLIIGIPRALNMYEELPFWRTLFEHCGFKVVWSDYADMKSYEQGAMQVMSDNICFPAKLTHSHILNLLQKGVDRIFMPYVLFEQQDGGDNSFNCPVVSGYSEIIRHVSDQRVPIDSPAVSFKDKKALQSQCTRYLATLGIPKATAHKAVKAALEAQDTYGRQLKEANQRILADSRKQGKLTILLAGRPYHTDPLIQHKLSEMVASFGANVITEDIVRHEDIDITDTYMTKQWAYVSRILKAAKWVAQQDETVQFVEMTSFGCGPDALLTDEVRGLLKRYGKSLTLLKIDDVCNIGSLKLRVRSVIESLQQQQEERKEAEAFVSTPPFSKEERKRTILAPFFTPYISPLLPSLLKAAGYQLVSLPESDQNSAEAGLKYANNEICYPATLIVGDFIKAFSSGRFDPAHTAVAISQTGGQCRASNYLGMIKHALVSAGYGQVPVISFSSGSGLDTDQSGFKINWLKMAPASVAAVLYSDCLAKMYHATVVRERIAGEAKRLLDRYLEAAKDLLAHHKSKELLSLLSRAAHDFNDLCTNVVRPKVGIVGEIFLKFNPFAQHHVTDWLIEHGIEVVPPMLSDFFMQSFVNHKVQKDNGMERSHLPEITYRSIFRIMSHKIAQFNAASSAFRLFEPLENIFEKARMATDIISLNVQFGEGWLLPAEVASLAHSGVNHVISLQPFGCIANHIISKGKEKRIKELFPDMNLLSLDFDSGISDVNVANRLLLFVNDLLQEK